MKTTTVRLDQPIDVLRLGAESGLLWSHDGLVLAGLGEGMRIPLTRPDGFAEALAALAELAGDDDVGRPGCGPVAFCALAFDPEAPGELIVPEVLVGTDRSGHRWATVLAEDTAEDGAADGADDALRTARAAIDELQQRGAAESPPEPSTFSITSPLTPDYWRDEIVAPVRDLIRSGELDKAVFARELVIDTDRPIPLAPVLTRLASTFPTGHIFSIDGFFGASPEQLISRIGDVVRAHPLAGTAPRSSDPDRDRTLATELMTSDKNRWEHRITISWLLDTLLPFCSYVDAEPEPSIITLSNVHHLGTRVEGRLSSPPASVLELVAALHPTPAVGGDPQADALELITKLEQADRGRYAGPTGWVDANGNGVFAVSVRSAQVEAVDESQAGGGRIRLFAGVGVVDDSDPQAELDETRSKFAAMLGALLQP